MRDDYYPYEDRFPREDYYPLGYRDDEEMCVYLHRASGEVVWCVLRNLRAILVISSFVIQSSHNPVYILNGLLYTHFPCMNPKLQGEVYVYLDNA